MLRNGRAATAIARFCLQGSDNDGNPSWSEVKAELEVNLPNGSTSTLRGLFNGDRKISPYVWPGTELPVKLHPEKDDKLVIDWKAWKEEGGLSAAQERGSFEQTVEANAEAHRSGGASDSAAPIAKADG